MDNKRRSSAMNGAMDAQEPNAKKQKLAAKYNLKEHETVESTTDYGHFFLDQIRRTADKNGRKVSGYFETLPDKDSNPDYYKKTKMPISLTMIEKKLDNGDFPTLTELESYCKRMVSNAKEFYPRGSQLFEDAERVRKALSNFMTKYNPAYARGGYTAVPTPLPVEGAVNDADGDENHVSQSASSRRKSQVAVKSPEQDDPDRDEDADENEDEEEDDEENDAEGEEDDDEGSQTSKHATILIRRRGPGRPSKGATPRKANARTVTPSRPDCEYEDVPYKGLTFQAAQEKIVEEMLRKKDDGGQEPYFEPFVNLPPRVLKDYYRIVKEPISLKKLQKTVKGVRGRNEATGTSEFKNWAAFEETASLLWKNAFFYNEEGSEIYELAQELEDFFKDELKKAKAVVQEPAQPKIKLKVQQPASEQPATSKKITIHVGGKSDSGESPAPPVSHSAGSHVGDQTPIANGATRQGGLPVIPAAMDKLRSVSVASPSPSVTNNIKREDATRPSPAGTPGHAGTPSAFPPPAGGQAATLSSATFQPIGGAQPQPQTNGIQHQAKPLWDQARRAPGKGAANALITSLKVQTHPMVNTDRRFEITLLPMEKEAQQSMTVHMPPGQLRVQIILVVPSSLEKEGRQWKLFVLVNRQIAHQAHPVPGQVLPLGARIFEAQLQAGAVNNIEVSVAAALPKGQKLPSGADFEVEQMTTVTFHNFPNINEADEGWPGVQVVDEARWGDNQANGDTSALAVGDPPVTLQDVWDQAEFRRALQSRPMHPFNQSHMYFTNEGILTIYPPIDLPLIPPVYIDEGLFVAPHQPTVVMGPSKEYQSPSVCFPRDDYREPLSQPRPRLHSHPEHLQIRQKSNLPQFRQPHQAGLFNDFQFPRNGQMSQHNTASPLIRDILMTSQTRLRIKAAQQQFRPTEQSGPDIRVRPGFLSVPQQYRSQQHGCENLQPQVAGMSNMALVGQQLCEPIQLEQIGKHYRPRSGQSMQPQSRLRCELKSHFQQHDEGTEDNDYHGIYNTAERQNYSKTGAVLLTVGSAVSGSEPLARVVTSLTQLEESDDDES